LIITRLRQFWSYYRPYQRLFWADMACAFVVSGTTLALPLGANYITKVLLAEAAPGRLDKIYALGALMLGLVAINTACSLVVDYYGHMMGTYIESDMRRELLDHYQRLSFSFYDNQRTGQLMARVTHDLFAISEFFHHGPEDLAIAVLKLAGVLVILTFLNGPLTLLLAVILLLMTLYALYFHRRMQAALRLSRDRMADINAQVEDTLAGIRVVTSFTNDAIERRKFAQANQRFIETRRAEYRGDAAFSGGTTAFTQLLTITVIVLGGAAIAQAGMDLAALLTYLLCVGILIEPIQRLVNVARVYQEGMTGFERFQEIMAIPPDIQDAPEAVALEAVRGDIEFDRVSFRYQDDHTYVLQNLSLDIRAGEYVALVGSSGVGKTTLCSLVPRFYEVTRGAVRIDGNDVRDVSLRSLRQSIGVVQQDVYLFAGTVADNIRYGKPEASRAEIITAAQQANAHDFILALPQGYDTDIGQRGVKLSGGQKQRLSIARVFLKDPPILILDEATSALDYENERAVQGSLERLARNRTTLVIAHRLSTVRNADRIVVLTGSGIEEQGTHADLIARGGTYASINNLQLEI
jgi:ATP-binding cassette, subfamily B, bacterial